ncbi:acidic mammalian chitinase-like [Malaya genurostris]|uniref:acidic mammalian chitinase-like n=1 Tax=Malaya genurostris TaxID=325434 RepID=UPI0026F3C693|nr:acidic mammalian chitinase-like [Malaya genurostris]
MLLSWLRMSVNCFLAVTVLLLGLSCVVISQKTLFCYYGSWAHYRSGRGQFRVENIDPALCSHALYAFLGIHENGTVAILDYWLDVSLGNFQKFNELKKTNVNLKTLATIHGSSATFSRVAADSGLRWQFAESARDLCIQYGFDGIDINWEFPGTAAGENDDKTNFVHMLSDLREVLSSSGLMLTAAVGAAQFRAQQSYDIPSVSKLVDFLSLMTYDFNGSWDNFTGHNAPLFDGPSDRTNFQRTLNVNHSVMYWLQQGAPKDKVVVGIPLHARTFTLTNSDNYWLRDAASGPGLPGQFTNTAGSMAYFEICPFFTRKWARHWEDTQKIPFGVTGNQWIGYDDVETAKLKCDYIIQHDLAGGMVWSIERDDFNGYCGIKFPIMNTLRNCLQ